MFFWLVVFHSFSDYCFRLKEIWRNELLIWTTAKLEVATIVSILYDKMLSIQFYFLLRKEVVLELNRKFTVNE